MNPADAARGILYARIVDIRIGISNSPRELAFESSQTAAEIEQAVSSAIAADAKLLTLKDDKGKVYLIPLASLAYVEVGTDNARRVGFVA